MHRHAPGRSFVDVGCMWGLDGGIAFLAEASGARSVTGVDVMEPTDAFLKEHERRGSSVRFLRGDLHDPATLERVGTHDVVWCWGVLYHAPHPLLTLERLRSITGQLLILGTEAIPEIPGIDQACIFYPGLSEPARRAFRGAQPGRRVGISTPFDPAEGYGNWWWGITPSALRAMLGTAGFEVVETSRDPFHVRTLARPASSG